MPVPSPTPYHPHPGFLTAEDAAVKRRLSQLSVTDDRNTVRTADVFYRYPDDVKEKEYPFITIDLIDIQHAADMQISETEYYFTTDTAGMTPDQITEYSKFNYYPSSIGQAGMEALAASAGFIVTESFVPVYLYYQISTYARSQDHDRQLTALMLRRVTPFRRGFIEVPEDGTMRRFDLLNWNTYNVLDQEAGYKKRIFRKIYTMRMTAEIPASDLSGVGRALSIHGTLNLENESPIAVNNNYPLTEAF